MTECFELLSMGIPVRDKNYMLWNQNHQILIAFVYGCIHLKAFIFRYFDKYEHLHTNSIYSLSKIASGYRICRYGKLDGIVI